MSATSIVRLAVTRWARPVVGAGVVAVLESSAVPALPAASAPTLDVWSGELSGAAALRTASDWSAGSLGATTPITPAEATASAAATGSATSSARRRGSSRPAREGRGAGGVEAAIASTRARRTCGAAGREARSSRTISAEVMLCHPFLESFERPGEPCRDGGRADAEHAGDGVPIEVEDDPQRDHFALAGAERL